MISFNLQEIYSLYKSRKQIHWYLLKIILRQFLLYELIRFPYKTLILNTIGKHEYSLMGILFSKRLTM